MLGKLKKAYFVMCFSINDTFFTLKSGFVLLYSSIILIKLEL